jgi:hypothetical protein
MPDHEAPGLTLSNEHHWRYRHYVRIHSEPVPFCLDKLIPVALPLLEAPPVVCLVHLYKLLCGITLIVPTSSNALSPKGFLKQESKKSHGVVCGYFCDCRTCWMWCLTKNGCTGALWFATQQTAISRCVRRSAPYRCLIAAKLNVGYQFGLVERSNGAHSYLSPGNSWPGLVFPKL